MVSIADLPGMLARMPGKSADVELAKKVIEILLDSAAVNVLVTIGERSAKFVCAALNFA